MAALSPQHRKLRDFARRATKGQRGSSAFLQIWDERIREDPGSAPEVLIQLGYAMILDQPIVVVAPDGSYVPDNIRRAAHAVEFFDPDDMDSMKSATLRALKAADIPRRRH